jgi:hypothetical protein
MDFRRVLTNVRNGKVARLSGTAAELRDAHKKIDRLINDDHLIEMRRLGNCLYIYQSSIALPQ